MTIHISIIVSRESKFVSNKWLAIEEEFATDEEAHEFQNQLQEWVAARPIPGQLITVQPVLEVIEYSTVVELAEKQANELLEILDRLGPEVRDHNRDLEYEHAWLEKRPYDVENLH